MNTIEAARIYPGSSREKFASAGVKVSYLNEQGDTVTVTLRLKATALQHQIDHLAGKMFSTI